MTSSPTDGPGAAGSLLARTGAYLFDRIVSAIPFMFIVQLVVTDPPDDPADFPLWALLGVPLLFVAMQTITVAVRGQSPGKALLGLEVVRFVDGGRLSWNQAALRAVIPALPTIFGGILLTSVTGIQILEPLIYLSAVMDPTLRGLPDRAAGSIVLRTR